MACKKGSKLWEVMFDVLKERSDWWIPIPHFAVIFKTLGLCVLTEQFIDIQSTIQKLNQCNMISQNMTNT